MFLKLFAPQRLEGMATAVQSVKLGGIGPFTAQITPFDFRGFYAGIIRHIITHFSLIKFACCFATLIYFFIGSNL
jgi:hypothetical protein